MSQKKWHYYNDIDPNVLSWVRELIALKLVPDGEVDGRSISEVQPDDVRGFIQCHWFCGVLGWPLALRLAGWDDSREIWTGSCPCQPFSAAGKGRGVEDERHLWPQFARLIAECKPSTVVGEQVASKAGREWLAGVRADLEGLGYAVGAADLCAASVGAPHIRQRLFWGAGRLENARPQRAGWGLQRSGEGVGAAGQRASNQLVGSGSFGGLADSACSERWTATKGQRDVGDRADAGRQEANGGRGVRGEAGGMGDSSLPRSQGRGFGGNGGDERITRPTGLDGWSNFDLVPCADGKARRIESGTFPLVAGLSRGLVPSGDPSAQEAQATAEARVMRLKGYGNAIVPQVAAEFIRAFMEVV